MAFNLDQLIIEQTRIGRQLRFYSLGDGGVCVAITTRIGGFPIDRKFRLNAERCQNEGVFALAAWACDKLDSEICLLPGAEEPVHKPSAGKFIGGPFDNLDQGLFRACVINVGELLDRKRSRAKWAVYKVSHKGGLDLEYLATVTSKAKGKLLLADTLCRECMMSMEQCSGRNLHKV